MKYEKSSDLIMQYIKEKIPQEKDENFIKEVGNLKRFYEQQLKDLQDNVKTTKLCLDCINDIIDNFIQKNQ
ncbi:hypothetical protein J6S88_00985 [bacterium]|nr:hypothetical protein [bacterium]